MHSTADSPVAQITGAPMVQLVDIDGHGVPDHERYSPVCDPDPTDPSSWPAWADDWYWTDGPELGLGPDVPVEPDDDEEDGIFRRAVESSEPPPPEESEDTGEFGPPPVVEPDAPDADPAIAFPGTPSLAARMALAPIRGGSPDYTDDDHADHMAWLDGLDAGYPPDDQAGPAPRGYTAETLGRIHLALYGRAEPFHA